MMGLALGIVLVAGLDLHVEVQDGPTFDMQLEKPGHVEWSDGEKDWMQVTWWHHPTWEEVSITNASIERAPGNYRASYLVSFLNHDVLREDAFFQDGTGFLEVFNEPRVKPLVGRLALYHDQLPKEPGSVAKLRAAALAWKAPPGKSLDAFFPIITWDPLHGTSQKFDIARNRHQTGSPDSRGVTTQEAAYLDILSRDPGATGAAEATKRITLGLWGFIIEQARRPDLYLHDGGVLYRATEIPESLIGESGPSGSWGHKIPWGRDKITYGPLKEPGVDRWTGIELEHHTIEHLLAGWLLYDSQFCLQRLTAHCEGLMTWPYIRGTKVCYSPRTWGWAAKALALVAALHPDIQRRADAWDAVDRLLDQYLASMKTWPTYHVFPGGSDCRHICPTEEELAIWADWKGWPYPDVPDGVDDVPAWVIQFWHDGDYPGAMYEIIDQWSYVPPWQLGVCARAVLTIHDRFPLPDVQSRCREIAKHLLRCIELHARNIVPGGTYWMDYAVNIPGRHAQGELGDQVSGTTVWTAGGALALRNFAYGADRDRVLAGAWSVYGHSPELDPWDAALVSWMPEGLDIWPEK